MRTIKTYSIRAPFHNALIRPLLQSGRVLPVTSLIDYTSRVQIHSVPSRKKLVSYETMRLNKIAINFAAFVALTGSLVPLGRAQTQRSRPTERTQANGFLDSGKVALSRPLRDAVSRGDAPGVVALIVGRDGVLYEGVAGRLDVRTIYRCPRTLFFSSRP
jgi:hypothetical protein